MSDLKAIALELLEKYREAEHYLNRFSGDKALAAEVADYQARIEAAEPEIEAVTVMGPLLTTELEVK